MLPFRYMVSALSLLRERQSTRTITRIILRMRSPFIGQNMDQNNRSNLLFHKNIQMQGLQPMNKNRLQYNQFLMKGYSYFQNKDITKALKCYEQAFKLSSFSLHACLVKSIIGVLHIQACKYSEAINTFSDGLRIYEEVMREKKSRHQKASYEALAIQVKLIANYALCLLVIGQYNEAKQKVHICLELIRTTNKKWSADLFESLVYLYFRFQSFLAIKLAPSQNSLLQYDTATQACFYSTLAINKQLCQDAEQAFELQKRALQIWVSKNETGFILLSLRHILSLATELKISKSEKTEYEKQLSKILQCNQPQGVSQKSLFKNYHQKMNVAKEITIMLIEFEKRQLHSSKQYRHQPNEVHGWKLAARLKLLKAINCSKNLLNCRNTKNRQELAVGITQMQQTLQILSNESNQHILKNLQKSKFVLEAVDYLKSQLSLIHKFMGIKRSDNAHQAINLWRDFSQNSKNKAKIGPNQIKSKVQINYQFDLQKSIQKSSDTIQNALPINSSIQFSNQYDNYQLKKEGRSEYFKKLVDQTDSKPDSLIKKLQKQQMRTQKYQKWPLTSLVYDQEELLTRPQFQKKSRTKQLTKNFALTDRQYQKSPNKKLTHPQPLLNISPQPTPRSKISEASYQFTKNNNRLNKTISKSIKICEIGQILMKRNFNSNGGDEKFIRLTKKQIRWASDQNKINKQGKYQEYLFSDIKGIVYGKITTTMNKPCNKQLEPWRCFSLILKKRTLDLFCSEEEDINIWVVGVSGALVKATGKQNALYTPGKQLWTKMFLKLKHYFIDPQNRRDRQIAVPFAVALQRFIENDYRLPRKRR